MRTRFLAALLCFLPALAAAQTQPTTAQKGRAFVMANDAAPLMIITFSAGTTDGPVGEAYMVELPPNVKAPGGLNGAAAFDFRKAELLSLAFDSGLRITFLEKLGSGPMPENTKVVNVVGFERLSLRPQKANHAEAVAALAEFKVLPRRRTPPNP
jgi:hypothetical protein